VQVVGYDARGDGGLYLASDGVVESRPLSPGEELAYDLGERHCAGSIHDDRHRACEESVAPYCRQHQSTWQCARCTGDCTMPNDACHETHAVYLAAFAPDAFKVGVTREWRLETRLREQGADRAAHIRTMPDGRVARRYEAAVADRVGDFVRVDRKLAGLHESVDEAAWTDLLSEFEVLETFSFDYGLDLSARPVAETMAAGTVVGTKGRLLILSRGGTTYGVDMRDLVGYELREGTDDRDLQASLGAFE
jgi:hypothetical protein